MKAYVTSIGEPTTDLCIWALTRNGFEVELILDPRSLWSKLKKIYQSATEDFLRVDADIIVNRNMTPEFLESLNDPHIWWWQFITYDWYKQDTTHSMSYIKKQAIPALASTIERFKANIRPETAASRIAELENPRRMATYDAHLMGLHGYGIKDTKPVIKLKANRGQSHLYDFDLAKRLDEL